VKRKQPALNPPDKDDLGDRARMPLEGNMGSLPFVE
jgi:hypothetical protein